MVRSRIEDTTDNLNRKWVRSSINAPAHTLLDFVENKFETVMLKRSSGSLFQLSELLSQNL